MKRNTLHIRATSLSHHHVESRRGTRTFTTITMTRFPAESSLNPRHTLIHVNDVDDEIHDYDRERKKERKKERWTREEKKEEGWKVSRIKWQTARISFFPTPPLQLHRRVGFFCPPAARRAPPSRADPLKTLKYSLVNFLGFREKSVAREKRA